MSAAAETIIIAVGHQSMCCETYSAGIVVKELKLPNGSTLLRDVRVSPDGKIAAVAHTLARYQLPTTQLGRCWMNTSAITLIDLATLSAIVGTDSPPT